MYVKTSRNCKIETKPGGGENFPDSCRDPEIEYYDLQFYRYILKKNIGTPKSFENIPRKKFRLKN